MALKWNWHSNSNTQALYAAGWRDMTRFGNNALTLTTGPSGTFGTTYLDFTSPLKVAFPGGDNGPVGSSAFSIMLRVIPTFTGTPAANSGLFSLNGDGPSSTSGIWFYVNTAGKMSLTIGNQGSTFPVNGAVAPLAFTFTQNIPTDIWLVWDGSNTAGHVTVWQAQNGFAATQLTTFTASPALTVPWIRGLLQSIYLGYEATTQVTNTRFHFNEAAIFDTVEVPSSYGARTDFIYTGAAYEGYNFTSLAAGSVHNGTVFGPGPGSQTGTDVGAAFNDALSASNLKHGVTVNNLNASVVGTYRGADLWTAVSASNLKHGVVATQDGSVTGTYTGTDLWATELLSDLRLGVPALQGGVAGTGTLIVASPSDVRAGTPTDNTVGTMQTVTNTITRATLVSRGPSAVLKAR